MRELGSLLEAAMTFAAADIVIKEGLEKGMKDIAKLVEKTAKDEIGFYQPARGPFAAWADLAESTEQDKAAHGYPLNAPLERTGKMRDDITSEAEGFEAVIGSKEETLAFHEWGTPKMPPRPVLGPALVINEMKIKRIIGSIAVRGIAGGRGVHPSIGYDRDI